MCENRKLHQVWRDHPSMFMYQMPLLSHHVSKRPCDKNPQQENLFKLTPLVLVFFFFLQSFRLSEDEVLYLNSGRLAEVALSSVGSLSSPLCQLLAETPLMAV